MKVDALEVIALLPPTLSCEHAYTLVCSAFHACARAEIMRDVDLDPNPLWEVTLPSLKKERKFITSRSGHACMVPVFMHGCRAGLPNCCR